MSEEKFIYQLLLEVIEHKVKENPESERSEYWKYHAIPRIKKWGQQIDNLLLGMQGDGEMLIATNKNEFEKLKDVQDLIMKWNENKK